MKKSVLFLVTMAAVSVLFTACGSRENGADSEPQQTEKTQVSSVPVGDELFPALAAENLAGEIVGPSVFSGHKLTMVNFWGTYCGPCIKEMPSLGELNRMLADEGFQIIGVPIDVVDYNGNKIPSLIDSAKSIVETTGADYRHLIPSKKMLEGYLTTVTVIPTTVFVDEHGDMLGEPYIGSRSKESWEEIIRKFLEVVK